jgi:alkylation response protein AidB-like acyl-CoA dehydrogenase
MRQGVGRAEVRAWIDETWHPDLTVREWWHALAAAGLAFPTWPVGLGGFGGSSDDARDVARALADGRVVAPPAGVGQSLGAPTLLAHATPDQQRALVPALADGTECWCQLFSEPGAGSDLAGLQTRAERDGDEWVITGQKVWNSAAHLSDRGLLLARTAPDAPKHDGISYFVIDMDQPGVEVRPLRQMNGDAEFCEVFLTEARVHDDRLIGGQGSGWRVARTTLAFERTNVARSGARGGVTVMPGMRAGMLDRTVQAVIDDAVAAPRAAVSGFVIGNQALLGLARDHGRDTDAVARQALSRFRTSTEINRITGLRARAAAAAGQPGPEASTGKLAMSNIARASRELAFSLMGADGMLAGGDAPLGGAAHRVALASFGASMGGGTDQIQRNVIGERTLGLPKEPTDD